MNFRDQCREFAAKANEEGRIDEAEAKQLYERIKEDIEVRAKSGWYWHLAYVSEKMVGSMMEKLSDDGFKAEYLRCDDGEGEISVNWFE